jgi:plasmid stabilization system protein ParE
MNSKPAMTYKVRITPEAEADLRSIGDYIVAQHAPEAGRRFIQSLRSRVAELKTFPQGFGMAPEAQGVGIELRQMIHGMYRVLYSVDEQTVTIHAVRHGARRPLRPDELPRTKRHPMFVKPWVVAG